MTWQADLTGAGARRAERPEVHALRLERDCLSATAAADLVDQLLLIGGEAVGHLLGQPLDCARRENVRGVPFDELADDASAEGIAVHVQRGSAGAVFERLLVAFEAAARVGTGDANGRVPEPLAAAAQVGARYARVALTATDIGAAAVERVERRAEQLVTELERLDESRVEIGLAVQIVLIGVHGNRPVDVADTTEFSDDRPRRHAREEHSHREHDEKERTQERNGPDARQRHTRHPFSRGGGLARAHNSPVATDAKHPPAGGESAAAERNIRRVDAL